MHKKYAHKAHMHGWTGGQADGLTDRQTERQTGRQMDIYSISTIHNIHTIHTQSEIIPSTLVYHLSRLED